MFGRMQALQRYLKKYNCFACKNFYYHSKLDAKFKYLDMMWNYYNIWNFFVHTCILFWNNN